MEELAHARMNKRERSKYCKHRTYTQCAAADYEMCVRTSRCGDGEINHLFHYYYTEVYPTVYELNI